MAKAEKPGDRGAPAQEITAAQPSLPWSLILESLDLTEHQRKVRHACSAALFTKPHSPVGKEVSVSQPLMRFADLTERPVMDSLPSEAKEHHC